LFGAPFGGTVDKNVQPPAQLVEDEKVVENAFPGIVGPHLAPFYVRQILVEAF
jgi:hypothetical protein